MGQEGTRGETRSQISPRTVWTVCLNVLAFVAVLTVLRQVSGIISWGLIALLLALALDPVAQALEKRGLSRGLAVAIVMTGTLGLVALLVGTLVPMLIQQGGELVAAAPDLIGRLRKSDLFRWADDRFDMLARAKQEAAQRGSAAASTVFLVLGGILRSLAGAVTVFVLTTFMLLFGGKVFASLLAWVRPDERPRLMALVARMRHSVGNYVLGTIIIASVGGVVVALTLLLLGVPYFLPLGLAMMLLGVIPFLGAALGGLFMVGTTFASAGMKAGLIALAVFLVYQQAENHLLQPLVQRKTIKMNPLVITLVMLAGTGYAGVLGALFALPFAAAAQILLEDMLDRRRERWGEPTRLVLPAGTPVADGPARQGHPGRGAPSRQPA